MVDFPWTPKRAMLLRNIPTILDIVLKIRWHGLSRLLSVATLKCRSCGPDVMYILYTIALLK